MRFVKGHGTQNDFVLLPDPDGVLDLRPGLVVAICDRRAGLGADGVLRVVRTAAVTEVAHLAGEGEWFMDYRNADGSVAEMCGNGVRVFARYLACAGLVDPAEPLPVVTRGGTRPVRFRSDGQLTVGMGRPRLPPALADLKVTTPYGEWPATGVLAPNPHAVAVVDALDDAGSLLDPPRVTPEDAFPDGVNVEFVVDRGPRHVALRVHERGVGETRSCGTGVAAVAADAARRAGATGAWQWTVDVPGGRLTATGGTDAEVELTGPAVLVASGDLDERWLRGVGISG